MFNMSLHQDYTIQNKSGRVFRGFMIGFRMADNSPELPSAIYFIEESVSPVINTRIDISLSNTINIFHIEQMEI